MTQEAMMKKIEALNRDEAFVAKLKACETAEAICALYATEGFEITPEQLDAALDAIGADGNEFSATELDNVAGGIFISGAAFLGYCIAYSVVTVAASYTVAKNTKKKKKK